MLMGFNEAGALRGGWHDLERDGRQGVPYRATKAEAELTISRPAEPTRVSILISGSPSLLGRPLKGTLEVREEISENTPQEESAAKQVLAALRVALERDIWVVRGIDLPAGRIPSIRLRIRMDDLVVPDRVLRNGDSRGLGFYISAVWFG
jgi:hypothetical protein